MPHELLGEGWCLHVLNRGVGRRELFSKAYNNSPPCTCDVGSCTAARSVMGRLLSDWPVIIEAMDKLRQGVIGRVLAAPAWYANARPSIGRGQSVPIPDHLDDALWQGPAPERPYVDNLVPYNWHWRWHWGNGEMGNNGESRKCRLSSCDPRG